MKFLSQEVANQHSRSNRYYHSPDNTPPTSSSGGEYGDNIEIETSSMAMAGSSPVSDCVGQFEQNKSRSREVISARGFGSSNKSTRSKPPSPGSSNGNEYTTRSKSTNTKAVGKRSSRASPGMERSDPSCSETSPPFHTPRSIDEMEYGSHSHHLNKGKSSSESTTVMLVEFEVEEDYFIGTVDAENDGGDSNRNIQHATNTRTRSTGVDLNGSPKVSPRPQMRKMTSWTHLDGYETVAVGGKNNHETDGGSDSNPYGCNEINQSFFWQNMATNKITTNNKKKPSSKSSVNDSFSKTVRAVHAALQSCTISNVTASSNSNLLGMPGEETPYKLSNVQFSHTGCVWDATLQVLPVNAWMSSISSMESEALNDKRDGFDFPIIVTCFCADEGEDEHEDAPKMYNINLSLKDESSSLHFFERAGDIASAMEWVRRKLKRSIRRDFGKGSLKSVSSPKIPLPIIRIRLPERESRAFHTLAPAAPAVAAAAPQDQSAVITFPAPHMPKRPDYKGENMTKSPGGNKAEHETSEVPQYVPKIPDDGKAEEELHMMPKIVDVYHKPISSKLETSPLGDADSYINPQGLLEIPDFDDEGPSPPSSCGTGEDRIMCGICEDDPREQMPSMKLNETQSFIPETSSSRNKPTSSNTAKSNQLFGMSSQTALTVSTVRAMTESDSSSEIKSPGPSRSSLSSVPAKNRRMASMGLRRLRERSASSTNITNEKKESYVVDVDSPVQPSIKQDYAEIEAKASTDYIIDSELSLRGKDHAKAVQGIRREARNKSESYAQANIRTASMGLMSQKSIRRLSMTNRSAQSSDNEDATTEDMEEVVTSRAITSSAKANQQGYNNQQNNVHGGHNGRPKSSASKATAGLDLSGDTRSVNVPKEVIHAMERGSYSAGEIRLAKKGCMSRKSIKRLSNASPQEIEAAAGAMDHVLNHGSYSAGEIRTTKRSLTSQRSSTQLSVVMPPIEDIANDKDNKLDTTHQRRESVSSCQSAESFRLYQMGLMNEKSFRRFQQQEQDAHQEIDKEKRKQKRTVQRTFSGVMKEEHRPQGEIRMARKGLMSQKTMANLKKNMIDNVGSTMEKSHNDSDESLDFGGVKDSWSEKQMEQAKMGLLSGKSLSRLGMDRADIYQAIQSQREQKTWDGKRAASEDQFDVGLISDDSLRRLAMGDEDINRASHQQPEPQRDMPEGELRMAKLGCLSRKSRASFRNRGVLGRSSSTVSFTREVIRLDDAKRSNEHEATDAVTTAVKTVNKVSVEDDKESEPKDTLVFSDNELAKKHQSQDILTEGQSFLGISMLVYMYSHLRETCRMGHTHVKMEDIDVHSIQSQYKGKVSKKYLESTKTAGSIIRVVIDELDGDVDDEEHDIIGNENKEYEKSITEQFRQWIEDSRVSQLDEETQEMIREMKRKVARHRWRRAISAVRLSYKLSGGKRPKFDNPVTAPGCETQNRFVDMSAMVSEAVRSQPKYFREGSVMHNLIESEIEMVWFSDMSQNDVVYGICVQREEKKVTVVFRGTVNAHNWKMNLKFDTNEYHNPVKQDYPGRVDELSLHSGFALYLLRKRKDTGESKLQEIFDKIDEIGREMAPDGDYKLSITGHSLGGALATLCGFYVAARSRFANLSTIYVWTFGSPRVGTQAFTHAWQHLERTGRIRHARFSVTRDLVPLVPFCNFEIDDLQFYKHVGMRVQMHGVGRIGKWRLRRNLDVTYPLRHDWPSEIRRVFMNNIFANLTTLSGVKNNHQLTEYQKRLHFAMTYRKALGSGVFFSDKRRNRIKSLDEYYHIRANITSDNIPEEISIQSKSCEGKDGVSRILVYVIVLFLLLMWVHLIDKVTYGVGASHLMFGHILSPFAWATSGVWHVLHSPVTLSMMIYNFVSSQARKVIHSLLPPTHHVQTMTFIGRRDNPELNDMISQIAVERANHHMGVQHNVAHSRVRNSLSNVDITTLKIFDSATIGLFDLAALVDEDSNTQLTIATPNENEKANLMGSDVNDLSGTAEEDLNDGVPSEQRAAELQVAESKLKPLQEYATGITFAPKLDEGLYLVGAGVRKKSIIKVYAVAMYSSAAVLNVASHSSLGDVAGMFDTSTPMTSFVLEMVYSVGAEKIAAAIAESIKPRYGGLPSAIDALESLISEGVNEIGGQATKGTHFRFDCSQESVRVSVNRIAQGSASFAGLGRSFVDVFMDNKAVSPSLVDSCRETWSDSESKDLSASLLEATNLLEEVSHGLEEQSVGGVDSAKQKAIESQMKPLQGIQRALCSIPN